MTPEDFPLDADRIQEIQRERERLSREMEAEVQQLREYIRYGDTRPASAGVESRSVPRPRR